MKNDEFTFEKDVASSLERHQKRLPTSSVFRTHGGAENVLVDSSLITVELFDLC